jgi:hypothetical protein
MNFYHLNEKKSVKGHMRHHFCTLVAHFACEMKFMLFIWIIRLILLRIRILNDSKMCLYVYMYTVPKQKYDRKLLPIYTKRKFHIFDVKKKKISTNRDIYNFFILKFD